MCTLFVTWKEGLNTSIRGRARVLFRKLGFVSPRGPTRATTSETMAQIPSTRSLKEGRKARVLVVDDQPVVRERLELLIAEQADMVFCGACDGPHSAFDLIQRQQPNVVITGLALKDAHGLEFIKDLQVGYPELRILVFSMYEESVYAERSVRAGASGFLTKREPTSEVLAAVRSVVAGDIYLSRRIGGDTIRRFFGRLSEQSANGVAQLSDREVEILELMGRRLSTRQMASSLHLSLKTVETYRARMRVKLGLSTGAQLVQYAQESLAQRGPV